LPQLWLAVNFPPVADHDLAAGSRPHQVPGVKGINSWRVTAPPAVVNIPSSFPRCPLRPDPAVRTACPGQARHCVVGR